MTRQDAENFVYSSYLKASKLLDYSSADSKKRHPELTQSLLQHLSIAPSVAITGSKGKGSVAHLISIILEPYFKIGLLTSPHVIDFTERIRVNGVKISDEDFAEHTKRIKPQIDKIEEGLEAHQFISPIGIQAAIALRYFSEKGTSFNVLECGKGAKFDDISNIPHLYSVINTIFLEHTRELGGSLEEIASDKAHIISGEEKYVFIGLQTPEVKDIIRSRAIVMGVPLRTYGEDFYAEEISLTEDGISFDVVIGKERYSGLELPVAGEFQAYNCALAMALCQEVAGSLDQELLKESLKKFHHPGRMQVLSKSPFILLDACINRESAIQVKKTLERLRLQKVSLIMGIPDDKDYLGVAECLKDCASQVILTRSSNPHYHFSDNRRLELLKRGISSECTSSVKEALTLAKKSSRPIIILGTTSLITDVLRYQSIIV